MLIISMTTKELFKDKCLNQKIVFITMVTHNLAFWLISVIITWLSGGQNDIYDKLSRDIFLMIS